MFWDNYVALCVSENSTPTAIGRDVCDTGSATVSLWKKHKDDNPPRIPRDPILMRITNHFGVTREWLLADHSQDGELDRLLSGGKVKETASLDEEAPPTEKPEEVQQEQEQKEIPAKNDGEKAGIPLIQYCQLSDDNRAAVNVMIDSLLRLQNQTGTASAANPQ